jgi:hypothetical protein
MQPSIPQHKRRVRRLSAASGATILITTLTLAACGAGTVFQNVGSNLDGGDQTGPVGAAPAESSAADRAFDPSGSAPPLAALADRQIVKTGEVTVQVDNVSAALGRVRTMTSQLGGYVGGSQAGTLEDSATLTLRIPADRFEDALSRLHELDGEVQAEATREEDVTSAIVDMEARIANLEASERQYRALLERAEAIDDVLAVQTRLDGVRGEIEQLKAQLEQLSGLAGMSTLTVTLTPSPTPVERATEDWDPSATVDNAVASLVGFGQGTANLAIWFGIVGLPLVLLVGAIGLVVARVLPVARRRVPEPPVE